MVVIVSVAHQVASPINIYCVYNQHFSFSLHAANCSDPAVPRNGLIGVYQNTTEGAEIFFRCNPGFAPAGRMTAVCGADGRWNPDPADLTCTCKSSYMSTTHI